MPPHSKRRGASPLMSAMGNRVGALRENFISDQSNLNHSFEVSTDDLEPDENQPRKRFTQHSLEELGNSLQLHGQLTPLLVRPKEGQRGKWIIVAGERRWRAARLSGLQTLLAIEKSTDHEIASLIENIQREDLTPLEEAKAISEICEQQKWSQREAAKQLGRAVSDINGVIGILRLPEDFLNRVLNSEHALSRNLLIELARVPEGATKTRLLEMALEGTLSISEIRRANLSLADDRKVSQGEKRDKNSAVSVPSAKNMNRITIALKEMMPDTLDKSQKTALRALGKAIEDFFIEYPVQEE